MLLKMLRILKLDLIADRMTDRLTSNSVANLLLLVKLSILAILLSHWTACGFYLVSYNERFDSKNSVWIM
jgi:hypothetical protein